MRKYKINNNFFVDVDDNYENGVLIQENYVYYDEHINKPWYRYIKRGVIAKDIWNKYFANLDNNQFIHFLSRIPQNCSYINYVIPSSLCEIEIFYNRVQQYGRTSYNRFPTVRLFKPQYQDLSQYYNFADFITYPDGLKLAEEFFFANRKYLNYQQNPAFGLYNKLGLKGNEIFYLGRPINNGNREL